MSIADTINSMRTNLGNAYDELENKGATIPTNKNIENLADAIASVQSGGEYQRPSDWLEIPTMDGTKDDIYILNGVSTNGINKLYFKVSGTGTIDWGDGNVESFTGVTNKIFEHTFAYGDLSDNSFTTHNNTKQALVHIQGDRGAITLFSTDSIVYKYVNEAGTTINLNNSISTDVYQISANVQSCDVYCSSANGNHHQKMEIFDWAGTITTTDMRYMFYLCRNLRSIPQLDTSSAIASMSNMFAQCSSLTTIPQLDTSNITSMDYMFQYCSSLKTIPQLDTSSVTNMTSMFQVCYSLQTIPQLDTSSVTNMSNMFYACSSLTTIPQLNTSNVTNMSSMFSSCYSLKSIPQLDASKATDMSSMSSNSYMLKTIKLYNAGASTQSSIFLGNLKDSTIMSKQDLVDLFNSLAINPTNETTTYKRAIQLGATLQGYLAECYVKDSGQLYTAILPTSDTEVDSTKTYYTYNNASDTYTQFSGTTFDAGTQYYELKTATWNRYDICDSTDDVAVLALSWLTDTKGWTIS